MGACESFRGGCVRQCPLLGVADSDVDMSTNALPAKVMRASPARAAGSKTVPDGGEHGTVHCGRVGQAKWVRG